MHALYVDMHAGCMDGRAYETYADCTGKDCMLSANQSKGQTTSKSQNPVWLERP